MLQSPLGNVCSGVVCSGVVCRIVPASGVGVVFTTTRELRRVLWALPRPQSNDLLRRLGGQDWTMCFARSA
ncbi:MAG: hypothetical protein ACI89X_002986 [Planctomycetota bacterium]|jgi:hypothetical protein